MRAITFILIFLLVACTSQMKPTQPPKDLIQKDSFKVILMEMTLLESYIEHKYNGQLMEYENVMKRSGDSLLAQHKVNFKQYKSSMMYYVRNEKMIDSIYTEIMDTLAVREAKIDVN